MAYVSKTWVDRQTEFPNRRTLVHQDTTEEQVIVGRNEGTVYVEGDAFSAQNMNNLESRINAGITAVARTDEYASLETESKTIVGAINELSADKNLAEEYDFTQTYAVGDYVIEGTQLYKCIEPVESPEAFDPDKWEAVLITDEMGSSAGAVIDDTTIDTDKTWSSSKIDGELGDKQGVLTAGTGISISAQNVISATGGGGSADIIKTVSGAVATITDGADNLPVKDLVAQIVPQQSGTGDPSPSNVRPISGWTGCEVTRCGKNMISDIQQGGINGTTGEDMSSTNRVRTGFIKVNPSTQYTVAVNSTNTNLVCYHLLEYTEENSSSFIDSTSINQATKTFTTRATTKYIRFTARDTTSIDITPTDLAKWQLELGSTATTYEPYNGTTYSVTWQTEAGTVYGGTIDLTTGVLTVTHGLVTLDGTETGWSANTPNAGFIRTINEMKSGNAQTGYCDRFATISNNGSFGVRFGGNNQITYFNHITDNVSGITTLDDWKAWLDNNPTTLVYPLATPQTYQLTPTEVKTILGTMNIFADTGNISVEYPTKTVTDIASVLIDDTSTASNVTWSAQKISQSGGGGASIDDTTTALDKTWSSSKISSELSGKQNTLTAGTGISISNDVISATGGGGASALDDLTDVDITTPSNGDVLKYNATAQKWENGVGGGGSQSYARNLIIAGDDLRVPVAPLGSSSSHFSPNHGFLIDNNTTNSITFYFGGGGIDTTKTYTLRMQISINGTVYFKKIENITWEPQYGVTFELGGVTFTIMVLSLNSTSIVMTNISSSTSGNFLQAVSLVEENASELPFNGTDSRIVTELRGKLTYKDLTDTLTAGNTSLTISDDSITTSSTIDVYTDTFGINPTNVAVSTGSVVLTFAALQSDLGVKVRVS